MFISSSNLKKILNTLRARYPVVNTQLSHETPFQLLIATILSAQCTDNQVNKTSKELFACFPDPESLSKASLKDIERLIYSTGFYKNKAKNIKKCAKALIDDYDSQVPDQIDELVKLPGVGRKTANVVLSTIFNVPAIVVDTHVLRISQRLGLTDKKDPVNVEFSLMKVIPEKDWSDFSLWLIYFGREVCNAKKPLCSTCPFFGFCKFRKESDISL